MRRTIGLNKFQKAARKPGQRRIGNDEVACLVEQSHSTDPSQRLAAAELLCPCHVRRHVAAAWAALYRLLEDPDVRVRRAAWHTLGDGGRPEDPTLDGIIVRAERDETDRQIRRIVKQLAVPRHARERAMDRVAGCSIERCGKCDFCGAEGVAVSERYDTAIPDGVGTRAALACARCEQ